MTTAARSPRRRRRRCAATALHTSTATALHTSTPPAEAEATPPGPTEPGPGRPPMAMSESGPEPAPAASDRAARWDARERRRGNRSSDRPGVHRRDRASCRQARSRHRRTDDRGGCHPRHRPVPGLPVGRPVAPGSLRRVRDRPRSGHARSGSVPACPRPQPFLGPGLVLGVAAASVWGLLPLVDLLGEDELGPGYGLVLLAHLLLLAAALDTIVGLVRSAEARIERRSPTGWSLMAHDRTPASSEPRSSSRCPSNCGGTTRR
jgi:hypothetical protein